MTTTSNNGFWDRSADERAEMMDEACIRNGIENFFDLPSDERAKTYYGEDENDQ